VAGQLSVKQFSYDNYDVSTDVDTVITHTYTYDDDARLIGYLKNVSTDENEDGVVDVVAIDNHEWSYDDNGLLTRHYAEYSERQDDAGGLQEHTESLAEYAYTAGLLSRYHDRYQMDTDLDGDMDLLYQDSLFNYRYENGYLSTKGNLPALPGDPKSLTVPGVIESLHSVNRSKFSEKEAFDEQHPKLMSFSMGLQVSHRLDTQVPS
jgi:hypothetical protein